MNTASRVSPKSIKRTQHARGNSTHPVVAHLEGLVEAMTVIRGATEIETHAARAGREFCWGRYRLEAEYRDGEITAASYFNAMGDIDRLERRKDDILMNHAVQMRLKHLPEIQRCYQAAEYAR